MKKIGLIAGMSWESSAIYYKHINQLVNKRLGKAHAAEIIMYSVDYEPFLQLGAEGRWDIISERTNNIAEKLSTAGADFLMICCNTVHLVAEELEEQVQVPFIHIVDPCGEAIQRHGLKKVGLLGTRLTMERDFFKQRLAEKFGVETMVPEAADRQYLDNAIKNEFCKGEFLPETKKEFLRIIEKLQAAGAEGVILGCTEIPILIQPEDVALPTFDTTFLHSQAAVEFALN
ncbi:aspartate/glutamate racemase family protein [Pedobacter sp. SYSU D00535]|uniref:aspartate/glutamate racemase family protein n=1 Tax=Pedobacter sp. SYSU D00535 TaxID=2810308 RepID=UPI001A965511|nr:aspartate/glutamate racemase family protein [Pedobacter sp. SYSU D00535]